MFISTCWGQSLFISVSRTPHRAGIRTRSINTHWNNLPKHQGLMWRACSEQRIVLIFSNTAFRVLEWGCQGAGMRRGQGHSYQRNFIKQKMFGAWKQELLLAWACAPFILFLPFHLIILFIFLILYPKVCNLTFWSGLCWAQTSPKSMPSWKTGNASVSQTPAPSFWSVNCQ